MHKENIRGLNAHNLFCSNCLYLCHAKFSLSFVSLDSLFYNNGQNLQKERTLYYIQKDRK